MKTESRAPRGPAKYLFTILIRLVAFTAVFAATYAAIEFGFGWLVAVCFVAGLVYAAWLAVEGLAVPPVASGPTKAGEEPAVEAPMPAPPTEIVEPPDESAVRAEAEIRIRVMDELVWGNTNAETMAMAGALVGPNGNVIPKYIELRIAELLAAKSIENDEAA